MSKKLLFLFVFLSAFFGHFADGCNCPKNNVTSQQKQGWEALASLANYDSQLIKDYCRADFCLEASVKSDKSFIEGDNGSVTHAFYNFRSVRYFRYKPSSLDAIESGLFLTPLDDCGVDLKTKGIYYLCGTALGPNAWITACDFGKKFESLSFAERIFFLAGYKKVNCQDQSESTNQRRPQPQRPQPPQPRPPTHSMTPERSPTRPNYESPKQRPNNDFETPSRPQRPPPAPPSPPSSATQRPNALQMFPVLTNFSQINEKPKEKPEIHDLIKNQSQRPSVSSFDFQDIQDIRIEQKRPQKTQTNNNFNSYEIPFSRNPPKTRPPLLDPPYKRPVHPNPFWDDQDDQHAPPPPPPRRPPRPPPQRDDYFEEDDDRTTPRSRTVRPPPQREDYFEEEDDERTTPRSRTLRPPPPPPPPQRDDYFEEDDDRTTPRSRTVRPPPQRDDYFEEDDDRTTPRSRALRSPPPPPIEDELDSRGRVVSYVPAKRPKAEYSVEDSARRPRPASALSLSPPSRSE